MSRVTRAASRAASRAEQLDQENLGSPTIDTKLTNSSKAANARRAVLGEITTNGVTQPVDGQGNADSNATNTDKALKPLNPKGRKGNKNAAREKDNGDVEGVVEACHDGLGINRGENKLDQSPAGALINGPTGDDQTPRETQGCDGNTEHVHEAYITSPSDVAITPNILKEIPQLTPRHTVSSRSDAASRTPKFDPNLHRSETKSKAEMMDSHVADDAQDSFVKSINSRTPLRPTVMNDGSPQLENNENSIADNPDSFLEEIKSRSPAKPSKNGPEDPIEALDALEDEIERVTQDLSPVASEILEPTVADVSNRPDGVHRLTAADPKQNAKSSSTKRTPSKPTSKPTVRHRPSSNSLRVANTSHKMTVKRPLSGTVHASSRSSTAPSKARSSFGVAANADRRTSISTRKPAFIPSKSNKPPTNSTFTLPSAIISAQKKAQKEARLKAEQEELQRRRSFKANPVRISGTQASLAVRGTASSQARASLAARQLDGGGDDNDAAQKLVTVRTSRVSSSAVGNGKALKVAKRPTSSSTVLPQSHSSHPSSSVSTTAKSRPTSLSLPPNPGPVTKSIVTKEDAIRQKARAKEIVGRDKVAQEERERQRRDKEEAAKKARAEAAERGRNASREWAEKQKRRMEMEKQRKTSAAVGGSVM